MLDTEIVWIFVYQVSEKNENNLNKKLIPWLM